MKSSLLFAAFAMTALSSSATPAIDLSGRWQVTLDRRNVGLTERWFAKLSGQPIALPGSVQAAGLGDPVTVDTRWTGGIFDRSWFTAPEYAPYRRAGNIKVPFWLQPETRFTGLAWYQREVDIPAAWAERRIVLTLERPHWKTRVWLDEREIGSCEALSVPHVYALGAGVRPGRHRLTVRVDNTLDPDIGENSHSVSDHTQGNWNGIAGEMTLAATAPVWLDDVQVYPRWADRTVSVRGQIARSDGAPWPDRVMIASDVAPSVAVPVLADGSFAAMIAYPADSATWDEFTPALHRLTLTLPNGETRSVSFGFREVRAEGHQLLVNGRPLFLRGTLDCAAYPRTGHPPTDVAEWRRVLGVVRDHGLNHVRFHSWCPPEAAFAAADALGVYLQVEVCSWPNWSTTLGDGKPVDAWIEAETARIVRAYGNHPSFLLLCAGNEPSGQNSAAWLSRWVARQKASDPRRLYTGGAGWPILPENDYEIRSEPRIQHWEEGLKSRLNAAPPETRSDYRDYVASQSAPVVAHEIGQWCAYPDFNEIPRYNGYLKPRNFEIFRASLEAHGLGAQAHDFLVASGHLQALCYKEEIEAALRTPHLGGFQLLGLSDFPGQGTALVGVLNAMWEDKGYVSAATFRRFCNATVPLARLDRRVFTVDELLVADLEVAHFGPAPLAQAVPEWRLVDDAGKVVAYGELPAREIPVGADVQLGRLELPLNTVAAPGHFRLVVSLRGTGIENDWDIWVYPSAVREKIDGGIISSSAFGDDVRAKLEAGATVFLTLPPNRVAPDPVRGPIALGFSSIFWNTAWTKGQAPHTLGILCDPSHPALAVFPTEPWSNWQWWYPVTHAAPMILDGLPGALRPVVQVIDDWFTNRKLALVFEARVGRGRLLVTSIDLAGPALDPVRRQLRASLLAYAASPRFAPAVPVSAAEIASLFAP
ncbi:MAG TPA: hypothetical protein VL200_03435 [Lacunisphaera sp.]|jgi:hypothetical protein|nr:hypothetical protein [Lacunisphaera sp.]